MGSVVGPLADAGSTGGGSGSAEGEDNGTDVGDHCENMELASVGVGGVRCEVSG